MEKRLEEPGFWDNPEVSQQVMKELKGLQDSVKEIEKLYTDYEDMLLLIDMSAGEDEEEETAEEVAEELQQFEAVFEQLRISTLLIGPYDRDNAIVTLHAGAGVLPAELTAERRKELDEALRAVGFELIDDRRKQTVERVKNTVIELVREKDAALRTNLSDYIADRLHQDYGAVSSLFSEIENTTIEQYFIAQKIERVKELLAYGELSLGEIADKLNYSSTAHLSAQFKKVTGLTPSHFRKIGENRRKPLDKV